MASPAMSNVTAGSPGVVGPTAEEKELVKGSPSDFLTARMPERRSARLSSALLDYKRPDGLNLVPLGTTWAVDLFVRPHNGVRRELIDLYNIVDSLQRRVQDLRSQDLKLFFVWWKVFAAFLKVTFDLMDTVLVPWALDGSAAPDGLSDSVRTAGRESLDSMLQAFKVIHDQLPRRPPDESLAKIIKGLVHVHPLFDFIEAVETVMPEVADGKHDEKQGRRMEKMAAQHYAKHGDKDLKSVHLQILARGMTQEMQSAWKRRIPAIIRILYGSQKNAFRITHLRCVDKLAQVE